LLLMIQDYNWWNLRKKNMSVAQYDYETNKKSKYAHLQELVYGCQESLAISVGGWFSSFYYGCWIY
jgi:hypothetical protein